MHEMSGAVPGEGVVAVYRCRVEGVVVWFLGEPEGGLEAWVRSVGVLAGWEVGGGWADARYA